MRLLITGSNFYDNHRAVFVSLDSLVRLAGGEIITVVHDGRVGAELIAGQIADASSEAGLENECHPDATAQELVDIGADRCLYFIQHRFNDARARDMVARARAAGIFALGMTD